MTVFSELDRFLEEIERRSPIAESFDGARCLVDGFMAWASYEDPDLGLKDEEGGADLGSDNAWYRSFPMLPTRVRGS